MLAASLATLIIAGLLASCQLSELFKKDEETETTSGDQTENPTEAMDFLSVDLERYIKLGQYKGVSISLEKPLVSEAELDAAIDELLEKNGYFEEITDRASAAGDTLNIDFEGYIDGVKFEGGTAAGQEIELSDDSGYIDGFADGLYGVMPGSNVTLNITFPDDYYEEFAGKPVTFEVTVNYILGEYIIPAFDDEFVIKYTAGEHTTTAAFREYYRAALEADLAAAAESEAYSELWRAIVDGAEVLEYPEQQVNYYLDAQKAQYMSYAESNNMDYATMLAYMGVTEESMNESAKSYTKEDLVFYSIVKTEGFEITDAEYQSGAAGYAEQVGASVAELEEYYGKDYIIESLLWDEVLKQLFVWADAGE